MQSAPFTLYRVENTITDESASRGDYASSDPTPTEDATFREALDALNSDCWDTIDLRGGGTVIAYPADYVQDYSTGAYSGAELIITPRRAEWGERLVDFWSKQRREHLT